MTNAASLADYDDLVHRIYDAALRPERLQDVLERLCELLRAPFGNLFSWTRQPQQGGLFFTTFPDGVVEHYQRIQHDDLHMRSAARKQLLFEGSVVTSDDLVEEGELFESAVYRQIWRPLGIRRMCGGSVFGATDSHHLPTVVSLHRLDDAPRFTPSDIDIVRRVLAHLSRALGVMYHLRDQALQLAATRASLDRLTTGIILFAADGSVEFSNRLTQAFDLSPAEARVALDTLNGGDVAEMARRLGRSPNTVKTQLHQVFAKTQVRRRTDLLKLILSLAGAHGIDPRSAKAAA